MSARSDAAALRKSVRTSAQVFAALGDMTRLTLVTKLSDGEPCSIARLTETSKLTRQAITKHLRVLEGAGIVKSVRVGRESQFQFNARPIEDVRRYLDQVSRQWDLTLGRLKKFVEQ